MYFFILMFRFTLIGVSLREHRPVFLPSQTHEHTPTRRKNHLPKVSKKKKEKKQKQNIEQRENKLFCP